MELQKVVQREVQNDIQKDVYKDVLAALHNCIMVQVELWATSVFDDEHARGTALGAIRSYGFVAAKLRLDDNGAIYDEYMALLGEREF